MKYDVLIVNYTIIWYITHVSPVIKKRIHAEKAELFLKLQKNIYERTLYTIQYNEKQMTIFSLIFCSRMQ